MNVGNCGVTPSSYKGFSVCVGVKSDSLMTEGCKKDFNPCLSEQVVHVGTFNMASRRSKLLDLIWATHILFK